MRAIAITGFGADPEIMQVPAPEPGPREVFVRMRAAGYNPVDTKVAAGAMKGMVPFTFPLILGTDGAGVVEATGAEVTAFSPGDEVFGRFADYPRGLGAFAEYGVAAEDGPIAHKPPGVPFEQAAAVPTASGTAHEVVETARLNEGKTVLIIGATGGVGQSAVQLAARHGARVIATAAPDAEALVRDLGASDTVDHSAGSGGGSVADQVLALCPDGIDAVLDLVDPAEAIGDVIRMLRPGGIIVSIVGALDPDDLTEREIRAVNLVHRPSGPLLADLGAALDSGDLRVNIQAQVPFEQLPDRLRDLQHGHARGKVVIEI
ncbi:NADP-dependent oxidoreductase [Nonomuraea glycinis]|uniref:NADPH:quinone reductase n=2 Tax=Nonomuraea glycinis TaxID=2047744 RepID=A0A918E620_9ACTN|nr:NADP-dependent oxidoreductase [Nonomuraea glycinis]GGP10259.1 NADPH:quinone reductase [Nonomuraea glycinis]